MAESYGIIGDGKAARHLARYLSLAHVPFRRWSRRTARKTGESPERALRGFRWALVLISDGAIEGFIRSHPSLCGGNFVHFSGALSTPLAAGLHPFAAFGERALSLSEYERIHFVGEKGGPSFRHVFPRLKNPSSELAKELKPYYHALCVLSGNFSTLLWRKLFRESEGRLGLPRAAAAQYLRNVSRNIEDDHEGALSGPLSRGDRATIAANMSALKGDPFREVYKAFARMGQR